MRDIERHSRMLAETSTKEYYRVYTYLCSAVQNFVNDQVDAAMAEKDFFSFPRTQGERADHHQDRISKQDHQASGQDTPWSLSTQSSCTVPSIAWTARPWWRERSSSSKYTQPAVCRNHVCNNRSRFVDFQKVRIKEKSERCCIPRSVDNHAFSGPRRGCRDGSAWRQNLDSGSRFWSINISGAQAESKSRYKGEQAEGVTIGRLS